MDGFDTTTFVAQYEARRSWERELAEQAAELEKQRELEAEEAKRRYQELIEESRRHKASVEAGLRLIPPERLKAKRQGDGDGEHMRTEALPEGRNEIPGPQSDGYAETKPFTLKTVSADEILTKEWPESQWLVEGLIPVGLLLLAGKSKVGKSFLCLQLAQAVACGGRFFDRQVDKAKVLYFALEDGERRLQERMKAQGWPLGKGTCDFVHMQEARVLWPLNRDNAEKLAQVIEREGYKLVILDTFSRLFKGDQNDAGQVTAALGPLQEVANRLGITIIVVDHHNKIRQDEDNLDPVLDILGSTQKGGVADNLLGLYKRQGKAGAILAGRGRDLEELRLSLRWDGLTKTWQLEGDADRPALTEAQKELVDAVASLKRATCQELALAVGRNKGTVYRSLQDLVSMGYLLKEGDSYRLLEEYEEVEQPKQPGNQSNQSNRATTGCPGCPGCLGCKLL